MNLPFLIAGVSFFLQNVVLVNGGPPNFVFRSDFRGPNDTFQNGMPNLGSNENLIDHVDGRSCHYGVANSAFVATTREESFARQWAVQQLWGPNAASSIYVYRIRATSSFYASYDSLMHAFGQTHNSNYRSRAAKYQHQHEWLAHNGIPANQIVEVTEYQRDTQLGNLIGVGNVQRNIRYDTNVSSHGNASPYPAGTITSDDVYAAPSRIASLLTACFTFCRRPSDSKRSVNNPNTCPKPLIFRTSLSTPTRTVWDPILKRPVQRIVPWVERQFLKWHYHHTHRPGNCWVDPGARKDSALIQVSCRRNDFYERFVVLLSAGGSKYTWVDQTYSNGRTGVTWNKWASEIPVVGTSYTLSDYSYTINDVFTGGNWWSNIKVYPVYPLFK